MKCTLNEKEVQILNLIEQIGYLTSPQIDKNVKAIEDSLKEEIQKAKTYLDERLIALSFIQQTIAKHRKW
jgi:hypothetical protein